VHRVPVTVLSRCQRFSLRRVPVAQLVEHYRRIAEAEGIAIAPAALGLIARAADGSVRDGLSLLDQAIALSGGMIDETAVRDMLGIADRGLVWQLFETVLRGDAAAALDRMDSLYQGGADPQIVLQDMLDMTHFLTRLKLTPQAGASDPLEEGDRERARPLAAASSMPVLARAWQMLLKGLEEVQAAPAPAQAASMVLVRLAYVADLPVPADLVRSLAAGQPPGNGAAGLSPAIPTPHSPQLVGADRAGDAREGRGPTLAIGSRQLSDMPAGPSAQRIESAIAAATMPAVAASPRPEPEAAPPALPSAELDPPPQSFPEVVALFDKRREALLRSHLFSNVHLVSFEPGRIEFRPEEGAPRDLANRLGQLLGEWTGTRWIVAVSQAAGAPTLAEQEAQRTSQLRNEVAAHPLVRAVLETFPGATIAAVRERFAAADAGPDAAADETGDDTNEDGASTGEDEL